MSSPCNERNWPSGTAAAGSASSQQRLAPSMQRQQSEPSRSSPKCLQQESIRHGQRWQCMALSSPDRGAPSTTALDIDYPLHILGPAPQKGRAPPQQQPAQQHPPKEARLAESVAGHRHHRIFVRVRVAQPLALAHMRRAALSHIPQPLPLRPYGRFKASWFESTGRNPSPTRAKRHTPNRASPRLFLKHAQS